MSRSTEYLTYSNTPSHTTTTHNVHKHTTVTSDNTLNTKIDYSVDNYLGVISASVKEGRSEEELIKLMSELDILKKEMEGCLERIQDTKIKRRKLKL